MAENTIHAKLLRRMFLAGAANLEANKEFINELNVFPVPDGDTGTNMTLTILSAAKEVAALENPTMEELARVIASGSLHGARGNSGVILSQLFRGFAKGIEQQRELTIPILAGAFEKSVQTAYKAVMKPKEGTILTVARGIADKAIELAEETEDLEEFFGEVLEHGKSVLAHTPELLPVLKEAGVVDSGGQGLIEVLSGAFDAYLGKEVDYSAIAAQAGTGVIRVSAQTAEEIPFGYCTEFIILPQRGFQQEDEQELKSYLEEIGDSIVCVADDTLVKIHVHTNDPGLAIQKGLTYGQLSRMKIDNMREEHEEKLIRDAENLAKEQKKQRAQEKPQKEVGFVVVSVGDGMVNIFRELGADYVIQGGQTMNPSTEDILAAVEQVRAKHVFVLPNNKNIILAANQAKELVKDKELIVLATSTVPQGIAAMISYLPEKSPKENEQEMLGAIGNVKSGQITYAVRDTSIGEQQIKEGDILGIGEEGILTVGSEVNETAKALIAALAEEDAELISLYYGKDISEEQANQLGEELSLLYPELDVDVQEGGQPIYYYVLSVE